MRADGEVGSKPQKHYREKEMAKQMRAVSPQRMHQDGRDGQVKVLMWGYLPASSPQRAPLLHPTLAPPPMNDQGWNSICSGGCGFAMAISDSGKVNTWGSTGDLGQSYVTAGKHEERPEPFPLPSESPITQAAAGWAHCVVVTDRGEVYTWGWRECVPASKLSAEATPRAGSDREVYDAPSEEAEGNEEGLFSGPLSLTDLSDPPDSALVSSMEATLKNKCNNSSKGKASSPIEKLQGQSNKGLKAAVAGAPIEKAGDDGSKKRRLTVEQSTSSESSSMASDENVSAPPCLVTLHRGVQILSVAAGGRHTLALSDKGQVWGWGYGGEGQLGLGTRIRTVSSPHPVPCFGSGSPYWQGIHTSTSKGINMVDGTFLPKVPGSYIKAVACGGRHSAALTEASDVSPSSPPSGSATASQAPPSAKFTWTWWDEVIAPKAGVGGGSKPWRCRRCAYERNASVQKVRAHFLHLKGHAVQFCPKTVSAEERQKLINLEKTLEDMKEAKKSRNKRHTVDPKDMAAASLIRTSSSPFASFCASIGTATTAYHRPPHPPIKPSSSSFPYPRPSKRQATLGESWKPALKEEVDVAVARFFYHDHIAFNAARCWSITDVWLGIIWSGYIEMQQQNLT
ncbi:hypothetical protein L7F22_057622 [Adiantum nelumboides]|nr:hypothetical protein [Adiantum nelumboides]